MRVIYCDAICAAQSTVCNLRDAMYTAPLILCNRCGAIYAMNSTRCNICTASTAQLEYKNSALGPWREAAAEGTVVLGVQWLTRSAR
eukprot:2541388-Pyramimonas_sp.AAC.1